MKIKKAQGFSIFQKKGPKTSTVKQFPLSVMVFCGILVAKNMGLPLLFWLLVMSRSQKNTNDSLEPWKTRVSSDAERQEGKRWVAQNSLRTLMAW